MFEKRTSQLYFKTQKKINSEHKNGPLGHLGRVPGAYPENDPQNDDVVHRDH